MPLFEWNEAHKTKLCFITIFFTDIFECFSEQYEYVDNNVMGESHRYAFDSDLEFSLRPMILILRKCHAMYQFRVKSFHMNGEM